MNKFLAAGLVSLLTIFSNNALAFGPSVSAPIALWPKGAPDEKALLVKSMTPPKPIANWWLGSG
jgi:hypothetical protein